MQIKNICSIKWVIYKNVHLGTLGFQIAEYVSLFLAKKNPPCVPLFELFRSNDQYYHSPVRLFTFGKNPTMHIVRLLGPGLILGTSEWPLSVMYVLTWVFV